MGPLTRTWQRPGLGRAPWIKGANWALQSQRCSALEGAPADTYDILSVVAALVEIISGSINGGQWLALDWLACGQASK